MKLFNETFFKLKRLLMEGSIRFDLVIAYPTLPEHPKILVLNQDGRILLAIKEVGKKIKNQIEEVLK